MIHKYLLSNEQCRHLEAVLTSAQDGTTDVDACRFVEEIKSVRAIHSEDELRSLWARFRLSHLLLLPETKNVRPQKGAAFSEFSWASTLAHNGTGFICIFQKV